MIQKFAKNLIKQNKIIIIFYSILLSLFLPMFIVKNVSYYVYIMFFCISYCILSVSLNNKIIKKRDIVLSNILGSIFVFYVHCGRSLDTLKSISYLNLLISIVIYTFFLSCIIRMIWNFLYKINEWLSKNRIAFIDNLFTYLCNNYLLLFLILLIFWTPAFIADFPGGFRYDATAELYQYINGYNPNFPLLHSFIVTTLLPLAKDITGSYDYGVFVYVLIQMSMISAMYTHIIRTFYKQKKNSILLFFITLYCGLFPVIQILVTQEVRDVLFSALLTYSVFCFYLLEYDPTHFLEQKYKVILFGALLSLTILSRNNNTGIITYVIIFIICFVIYFRYRKFIKRGVIVFLLSFVTSYMMINFLLCLYCKPMLQIGSNSNKSFITQPIARAISLNCLSKQELSDLEKYLAVEKKDVIYCPENGDASTHIIVINGDKIGFIKWWTKAFIKHPNIFLDAVLANTQNMWYPPSIIDGYNQLFTKKGEPYYEYEKCYYSINNSLSEPVIHRNYFPALLDFYTHIGLYISFEKIPIVSMLFSIGFQLWVLLFCLFYVLHIKEYNYVISIIILLIYMIISSFTPLVILRYYSAVFLSMPIIFIIIFEPKQR